MDNLQSKYDVLKHESERFKQQLEVGRLGIDSPHFYFLELRDQVMALSNLVLALAEAELRNK